MFSNDFTKFCRAVQLHTAPQKSVWWLGAACSAGSRARVGPAALVEAVLGFLLPVGSFPPDALDLAFGKPHSRVKHFSFCLHVLM